MLNKLRNLVIWAAIETVPVWFVWSKVAVASFSAPELGFGQVFAVVMVFKILLWQFTRRMDLIIKQLDELLNMALFSEQNNAHKYDTIANYLMALEAKYLKRDKPKDPEEADKGP